MPSYNNQIKEGIMKNTIYVLIIFAVLLSSCSRRNDIEAIEEINYNVEVSETYISSTREINQWMFVDAPVGLRIRNSPSIDGDIIGLLDDLTPIIAVKEDINNLTIDGIEGRWTFIETDDIRGWVFGGFLSFNRPAREGSMAYIIRHIAGEHFNLYNRIFFRDNNTLEGFLSDLRFPREFRIIQEDTFEGIHGEMITAYDIEYNQYELRIWEVPGISRHLLISISIELNEENFLNLFPHRNIEDFLADENFGEIFLSGSDFISYGNPEYSWSLRFRNGLLHSIDHMPFMP